MNNSGVRVLQALPLCLVLPGVEEAPLTSLAAQKEACQYAEVVEGVFARGRRKFSISV